MKASRLLIAGAATALLPIASVMAQGSTPDQGGQPSQPARQGTTFESLDTDGDGRISKSEAALNSSVSEQFSRYDQNGNGFIERDEVNATNTSPTDDPSKQ